jgi:hypothetical protein
LALTLELRCGILFIKIPLVILVGGW